MGLWVLADRTQAPSGAGSRSQPIVLSAPPSVRDSGCSSWRRRPRPSGCSSAGAAADRCPGRALTLPYNETYFEHAYLARYLGFALVEGGDLTVRDEGVFLKTVEGLQPVDVVLRRMDDGFCDPLELRGDSSLGVAGLVQAVRAGRVTIANALGSGVLETPAMLPCLPGLCRHLLGEDLACRRCRRGVRQPLERNTSSPASTSWWSSRRSRESAATRCSATCCRGANARR